MLDPNVQQINNIPQINDASDTAGGAAVNPSYIVSDVPAATDVNGSVGIDSIEVSSGVSTSQVSLNGAVEGQGSSNYIQSDIDTVPSISDLLDGYDMNSIEEVSGADKYIDPAAAGIQSILATLKDTGIIKSGMSEGKMILAIHKYIGSSYSYIGDAEDHWNSVSETIKNGGGDCEDLANLEASLITAALIDRGLSLEEAGKKINCVVVVDNNSLLGHVYVQYTGDDGSVKYLEPVSGKVTGSIGSSNTVLFSYNAGKVDVINRDFDYSNLGTAMNYSAEDIIAVLNALINAIQSWYTNVALPQAQAAYDEAVYQESLALYPYQFPGILVQVRVSLSEVRLEIHSPEWIRANLNDYCVIGFGNPEAAQAYYDIVNAYDLAVRNTYDAYNYLYAGDPYANVISALSGLATALSSNSVENCKDSMKSVLSVLQQYGADANLPTSIIPAYEVVVNALLVLTAASGYVVPLETDNYILIKDISEYWDSWQNMEAYAPTVIRALTNLLNAVNENFVGSAAMDPAVLSCLAALNAAQTAYNNAVIAVNNAQLAYNSAVTAFNTANTDYLTILCFARMLQKKHS